MNLSVPLFLASRCVLQIAGREFGNQMSRHSVPIKTSPFPTFRRILEALRVEWRNSTTCFCLATKEMKISNISFPRTGFKPITCRVYATGFSGFHSLFFLVSPPHAACRMARQRELNVRYCVLNGGT